MEPILNVVEETIAVMTHAGGGQYFGEAVTKLQHAEQCAWHAEQAGADEELILAALLHDIGHLLESEHAVRDERVGVINHDAIGAEWLLARGFGPRLAALVGGHVNAKRYLTAVNRDYMARLSPASRETLRLQGGPMAPAAADEFGAQPGARDMLRLRSWDELAKDPDWTGPGVESYRERLVAYLRSRRAEAAS
ncbi:MAG: HDIG domain-containing protein [Bryobacteraceae bacterium]|nr:HDIG domain-containing protein [Bryobacteraceae bacterium]